MQDSQEQPHSKSKILGLDQLFYDLGCELARWLSRNWTGRRSIHTDHETDTTGRWTPRPLDSSIVHPLVMAGKGKPLWQIFTPDTIVVELNPPDPKKLFCNHCMRELIRGRESESHRNLARETRCCIFCGSWIFVDIGNPLMHETGCRYGEPSNTVPRSASALSNGGAVPSTVERYPRGS